MDTVARDHRAQEIWDEWRFDADAIGESAAARRIALAFATTETELHADRDFWESRYEELLAAVGGVWP